MLNGYENWRKHFKTPYARESSDAFTDQEGYGSLDDLMNAEINETVWLKFMEFDFDTYFGIEDSGKNKRPSRPRPTIYEPGQKTEAPPSLSPIEKPKKTNILYLTYQSETEQITLLGQNELYYLMSIIEELTDTIEREIAALLESDYIDSLKSNTFALNNIMENIINQTNSRKHQIVLVDLGQDDLFGLLTGIDALNSIKNKIIDKVNQEGHQSKPAKHEDLDQLLTSIDALNAIRTKILNRISDRIQLPRQGRRHYSRPNQHGTDNFVV